ncbi:MAG: hypothetical protein GC164_04765 [Phycisphaera sp.]|nr:hypothetical protein [Phycisphaera sp.]
MSDHQKTDVTQDASARRVIRLEAAAIRGKPMNTPAHKSVGQKLDEVLEPYLADRTRLRSLLKEQKARRIELEEQIRQTQEDLAVVERTMLAAVRDAAKQDALLSAAFKLSDEAATVTQAEPDDTPNDSAASGGLKRLDRSNPLLNVREAERV